MKNHNNVSEMHNEQSVSQAFIRHIPVNEIKIQIIHAQVPQTLLNASLYILVVRVPELGGQKYLITWNTAGFDAASHFGFVSISQSTTSFSDITNTKIIIYISFFGASYASICLYPFRSANSTASATWFGPERHVPSPTGLMISNYHPHRPRFRIQS